MAQELMHAGMLRPDSADAPAIVEAREVAAELADAPDVARAQAPVALLFDYEADWAWQIQPHGRGLSYFDLVFETYRGLRKLGLSVDILRPGGDLSGYRLIVAPGAMYLPETVKTALAESGAVVLLGPHSGARTENMAIPVRLPPAMPGLDALVSRVESLRPDMPVALKTAGAVTLYREFVEGSAEVIEESVDGAPVLIAQGPLAYVSGWLDAAALARVLNWACDKAGLETCEMPEGVRRRETGAECFWFNYSESAAEVAGQTLPPISVTRV